MASTFFGLTIAYSGLNAANVALNTTSHNISNIQTEGYSRQQAKVEASDALRIYASYGMAGSGVTITDITQIRDSYYDYKYWRNNSITGEYSAKSYYMNQIEDLYFNEMTNAGFTSYYGDFCNALDSLSATPSTSGIRNQAIQSGQTLAEYFNNIAENLETYQGEANTQIKIVVDRVNTIAENIASLNNQISILEMNGGTANDLRDKRNVLVDELSGLVGVSVTETSSPTGSTYYNVKINNQNLVYGNKYNTLSVRSKEYEEGRHKATDVPGMYEITWSNGLSFDPYYEEMTGELKGYFEIRDGDNLETPEWPVDASGNPIGETIDYKGIPYYMAQTNDFLSQYTKRFNEIHMSGEDLNGNSTAEVPFFTIKNMTVDDIKKEIVKEGTVADIADVKTDHIIDYIAQNITAKNICVNPDLILHNDMMGTATTVKDGVETPDIATQLANLRKEKFIHGGMPEEAMQSIVSVAGINASAAISMHTNHTNIGEAIVNQRLSVMGVDKEEEAIALLKYQHAYELSSKVISVMNEIYNKLINETGV